MSKLPPGWQQAAVIDLLAPLSDGRLVHQGWSPRCETEPSRNVEDWGVLKTTAIQDGRFYDEHNKRLPESLTPRPLLEVCEGDLLMTCAGPRARCGIPALVRTTRPRLMMSGKMYRMRPSKHVEPGYVEAALRTSTTQEAIDHLKTGMSESGMNLTHERFATLEVPVAPTAEQRRIVAKLDALTAGTARARADLARIPTLAARYKQAVLTKAFGGELTHAHQTDQEVREGPQDYRELGLDEQERGTWHVYTLPQGWAWQPFSVIFEDVTDSRRKLPTKDYQPSGRFPIVDQGEVAIPGFTDREDMVNLSAPPNIVFGDHTRCVKFISERFAQGADGVKVLKPRPTIHPRYAELLLRAVEIPNKGYSRHMKFLRASYFPICGLVQQREVVRRVDRAFKEIERLTAEGVAAHRLLDRLDQAVLAKAFQGELVSQDPADEPASVLLDRIRAERAAAPKPKRGRRAAAA